MDGGRLEYTLESTRRERGEVVSTWRLGIELAGEQPREARMETRCVPGVESEEPWAMTLPALPNLRLEDRWRWPAALEPGVEFGGTAHLVVNGETLSEVRREHRVGGRERLTVPGGTFETLRVQFRESAGDMQGERTGTAWVASGVGLVRMVAHDGSGPQELVLVDLDEP